MNSGDALNRWRESMRDQDLSERTINERIRLIKKISADTGCDPLAFTTDDLARWGSQPFANRTKHTYRAVLRAWHKWLVIKNYRDDDPTLKLMKIKTVRSQPRPISTAHLSRAYHRQGMRRRTRMMILLGAYQGLRVSEIAHVKGSDINLIDQTIKVVGKGDVEVILPLAPEIAIEVANWPKRGYWFESYMKPGQPITGKQVSRAIGDSLSRYGASTAHQLRHWLGTELVRADVDLRTVQTILRHAQLNTTAIYTRVDQDRQRSALRDLPNINEPGLPEAA